MRKLLAGLVASILLILGVAASPAHALGVYNATNECLNRTRAQATYVLGTQAPVTYGPTAAHQWAHNDWNVRVRYTRSYTDPTAVFFNCRLVGNDSGAAMSNVSFYMGWAAPNYLIYLPHVPYWQQRLHPFVDPWTGQPW